MLWTLQDDRPPLTLSESYSYLPFLEVDVRTLLQQ